MRVWNIMFSTIIVGTATQLNGLRLLIQFANFYDIDITEGRQSWTIVESVILYYIFESLALTIKPSVWKITLYYSHRLPNLTVYKFVVLDKTHIFNIGIY